MHTQSDNIKCNVLLIGKTGTGKSSFANYLFETDKFTTGEGEPVTRWEDNFQWYTFKVHDTSVNIYDSVGLEPDNYSKWMEKLREFLSERQTNNNGIVNSANDIIHTIFYLINGTARPEKKELCLINDICNKYYLSVSVIITNCDIAKESEMSAIESILKTNNLTSFRVCSISKKTRGGDKIEPFGKEPAIKQILSDSYEKVGKELTLSLLQEGIYQIYDLRHQVMVRIDESDLSVFNLEEIESSIKLDDILGDGFSLDDCITADYKSYAKFLESFNVYYKGHDIVSETIDNISDAMNSIEFDSMSFAPKMNNIKNDFENGNLLDKICAVARALPVLLRIKNFIKECVDEMAYVAIRKLAQQMDKVKKYT